MPRLGAPRVATDCEVTSEQQDFSSSAFSSGAVAAPEGAARAKDTGRSLREWFWRVLACIALIALAFLMREPLARKHPGFPPFITFYPVVLLGALIDGVWAG